MCNFQALNVKNIPQMPPVPMAFVVLLFDFLLQIIKDFGIEEFR